jgi:hypothetical protein
MPEHKLPIKEVFAPSIILRKDAFETYRGSISGLPVAIKDKF